VDSRKTGSSTSPECCDEQCRYVVTPGSLWAGSLRNGSVGDHSQNTHGDDGDASPSVEHSWVDFGFAPWVQPAYLRLRSKTGSWFRAEIALGAMILVYTLVFAHLTWLQQSHYGTFDYDMGVFDQEIWLLHTT